MILIYHSQSTRYAQTTFDGPRTPVAGDALAIGKDPTVAHDTQPSKQLLEFWAETLDAMMKAEPHLTKFDLTQKIPVEEIDPQYPVTQG